MTPEWKNRLDLQEIVRRKIGMEYDVSEARNSPIGFVIAEEKDNGRKSRAK